MTCNDGAEVLSTIGNWIYWEFVSPEVRVMAKSCLREFALRQNRVNQSIILSSDAGYKSGSHEADVDLQLTNKM